MTRNNLSKWLIIALIGISNLGLNPVYAATNSKHKAKKTKISRIKAKQHSHDYMEGAASCYASKFVGRRTMSGDRFIMDKFTGASPTLPMRTKVKVTNLKNYKIVYVEINDRMAFSSGHVIDLPKLPANWIGLSCPTGMTKVKLEVVDNETYQDELQAQLAGVKKYGSVVIESGVFDAMNKVSESDYQFNYQESDIIPNVISLRENSESQ